MSYLTSLQEVEISPFKRKTVSDPESSLEQTSLVTKLAIWPSALIPFRMIKTHLGSRVSSAAIFY
jgi:hypothetical protein